MASLQQEPSSPSPVRDLSLLQGTHVREGRRGAEPRDLHRGALAGMSYGNP